MQVARQGATICVKRALPKLTIAADGRAPVSHNPHEARWVRRRSHRTQRHAADQRSGQAYISPPRVQRSFAPRGKPIGVFGPRLRS